MIDVDGFYVYRKYHSQIESDNFENLPRPSDRLGCHRKSRECHCDTDPPTHGMFECNISQFT